MELEISNLKLNGNNFISTEKIEESVFADNCSPVTISDGTTETVHPNMELVQIVETGSWRILVCP